MTVTRINGCKLNIAAMSEEELYHLIEQIGRNLDRMEKELQLANNELTRRALARSFDPSSAS
jgi:hypothetical protein